MIRLKGYVQPMTGVSLEYWELRSINYQFNEMAKHPSGQVRHIPREASMSTAAVPADEIVVCAPQIQVLFGGYHVPPKDSTMPVALHQDVFNEADSKEIERAIYANSGESIAEVIDRLALKSFVHFKDGEIEKGE